MSIFQKMVIYNKMASFRAEPMSYDNQLFHCPRVYAIDGFNVSLQIHNSNYCQSNNGYRKLGDTILNVEFGFPSINEPLMFKYSEMYSDDITDLDITNSVGSIPISVMEEVFTKHGGIDWDKTISVEAFNHALKD